jgi:hypothetical protein
MSNTRPDATTMSGEEIRAVVRDRYAASTQTVLDELSTLLRAAHLASLDVAPTQTR